MLLNIISFLIILFSSYTINAVNQENFSSFRNGGVYQQHQHVDLRPNIPGKPGIDYPIYYNVPETNFKCDNRHEGYYADVETRCQVFRICANTDIIGNGFGFLCPNGTIFSQKKFVCDWYRNVNCDESESFYYMNKELEKSIKSKEQMMKAVEAMITFPMQNIIQKYNNNNNINPFLLRTTTISPQLINHNNYVTHAKYQQNLSTINHNYPTTKSFIQSHNNQNDKINNYDIDKINTITKLIPSNNELFNNNKYPIVNNYQTTPATTIPFTLSSTSSSFLNNDGIERRPTTIIPITKDESESALKNLEKFIPTGKVYISNLGELSTDIGSSFDSRTSKIISNKNYEQNNDKKKIHSMLDTKYKKPNGQNSKLSDLSRRINLYLESLNQYSDELNADQSITESKYLASTNQQQYPYQQQQQQFKNRPVLRSNFASNINNAFSDFNDNQYTQLFITQNSNNQHQNQDYGSITSTKPSYHRSIKNSNLQSNSYQNPKNLADNVNLVFQSRMDEESQEELIPTTRDHFEPIYLGGQGNLAGFINTAVQNVNSEYRAGRQFDFQGNGFAKDRKQLSSTATTRNTGKNGINTSRTYLPPRPQGFKLPKSPDISTFASGFKLNNQDSFSMTLSRSLLDLPKLFIDEHKDVNTKTDKKSYQFGKITDELDKTDKVNRTNNKTKSNNRVTKVIKVARKKTVDTTKPATFNETDIKVKEKADNLFLQGLHQALHENNTKISITNNLLNTESEQESSNITFKSDTNISSAINSTVITTTFATPTTNKNLADFLTPTPIPVIELTHTQFPNSLIFSNAVTKATTTTTTTRASRTVTLRNSRNSAIRQTTTSQSRTSNRGSTTKAIPRSAATTTSQNYFYTVKSSNSDSRKVHSIQFGSEYNARTTTSIPRTSSTTRPTLSTSRSRQSNWHSSRRFTTTSTTTTATTTQTTPTINAQNSNDNDENDKTLTDLIPLANSYGFNRNNLNRIHNETKSLRQRHPKISNSSSRNFTTSISSSQSSSSVSYRTKNSFSVTSNFSTVTSRQPYKRILSNNSKNETNLQSLSNTRKSTFDRGYKNRNLTSVHTSNQYGKLNRTQANQENDSKKTSVYVELPGTKVQIAKSEEHGHFLVSNDPSIGNTNDKTHPKNIHRRPSNVQNAKLDINQQNSYIALDQYVQNYQHSGTTNRPTTTNFFLPFPTISPSRPPTQRPTTQAPTHPIYYHPNTNNQYYHNYQFQQQLLGNIQSSTEKTIFSIQPNNVDYYQGGFNDNLNSLSQITNNLNNNNNNNNNNFPLAQRRLDVVEDPEKEKSLYSGVSSYNVPLMSVGRLPADIIGSKKK